MRRVILYLAALFVLTSIAVADDWRQLRHDAGHTNASDEEARWPFTLLWRARIDRGIGGTMDAPGILPIGDRNEGGWEPRMGGDVPWPVFADGRVFVGARDGRFIALHARTGDLLWVTPIKGRVRDWAVWKDRVIVRTKSGKLLALDARTGRVLDRVERLPKSPDGLPSPTAISPIAGTSGLTLTGDHLIFQGGEKVAQQPGEVPLLLNGQVYALDLQRGDVPLSFTPFLDVSQAFLRQARQSSAQRRSAANRNAAFNNSANASGSTPAPPTPGGPPRPENRERGIDPNSIFVPLSRGIFSSPNGGSSSSNGGSGGGYGGSSSTLSTDTRTTGPQVNLDSPLGPTRTTHNATLMPVAQENLVIAQEIFPSRLIISIKDSSAQGRTPFGRAPVNSPVNTSAQKRVIPLAPSDFPLSDFFGVIYALDADTGKVKWLVQTDWMVPMEARSVFMNERGLVTGDGLVFAPAQDGSWVALDINTGQRRWRAPGTGGRSVLSIAPAVSEGYAYIVGPDHLLRAHDTKTGKATWTSAVQVDGAPLATKNAIVARVGRNALGVFEKNSGTLVWKQETSWAPEPVGFVDGIIYDLSPDGVLTAWATSERPFKMGLAWSKTHQNASCDVALIPVPWQENFSGISSDVLDTVRFARERSASVALSLTWLNADRSQLALPSGLQGGFADAAVRQNFVATAERLATQLKPAYLILGDDVNLYALWQSQDFPYFAQAYADAYKRIKEASPLTKVFVSFQYETLMGLKPPTPSKLQPPSFRLPRAVDRPQEDVLKAFADRLDFVGIRSELASFFPTPEAIPFNYYGFLSDRVRVPLFVTSVNWSGGDDRQQTAFLQRLMQTHYFLDTEAVIFADDLAPSSQKKWAEMREFEWTGKK